MTLDEERLNIEAAGGTMSAYELYIIENPGQPLVAQATFKAVFPNPKMNYEIGPVELRLLEGDPAWAQVCEAVNLRSLEAAEQLAQAKEVLEADKAQAAEANATLTAEVTRLNAESSQRLTTIEQLSAEAVQLTSEAGQLAAEVEHLTSEVGQLTAEVERLQALLAANPSLPTAEE